MIKRTLFLAIILTALLGSAGCSRAKYIVVTDRSSVNFSDGDLFYICLRPEEAERVPRMLMLKTNSAVKKYQESRPMGSDVLEQVLFNVVSGDYSSALDHLKHKGDEIPAYLRLLLKADVARENRKQRPDPAQLVEMYQAAFDEPGCDLNRDIIKLRIRQVRYAR